MDIILIICAYCPAILMRLLKKPFFLLHGQLQSPLTELDQNPSSIRSPMKTLAAALSGMARSRLRAAARTRGGGGEGAGRWTSPGHEVKPKGYLFNRTPTAPGESRQWEDWELPCYLTSFLTIVILGVGLNAKPDLTIETWAHQKALERLQQKEMEMAGVSGDAAE
ncbi:hypothetical protein LUZ60_000045 [Juncus effusus]|nr:hypothetical protein LUZ60_000045 [Juncus effusus]